MIKLIGKMKFLLQFANLCVMKILNINKLSEKIKLKKHFFFSFG